MNKELLLIFTRNPELGKCKTRLAATVGDITALEIYKFLLNHTVSITQELAVEKQVHYSIKVRDNDIWDKNIFNKRKQVGQDLGERMQYAFDQGFKEGFEKIIIIGSDMYDLCKKDLERAFKMLDSNDVVIGPAEDGGYYLLGMKKIIPELFRDKSWGTDTVLNDTLSNLTNQSIGMLSQKNDVDYYEDIKNIEAFSPFLKNNNSFAEGR